MKLASYIRLLRPKLMGAKHQHTYGVGCVIFASYFQDAIHELNSAVNRVIIDTTSSPKVLYEERCQHLWPFLTAIGVTNEHLKHFHIIHVAGSKGKGTTCAIMESVLRNSGYRTGFLSSPHLVNVEERIRIGGRPISKEQFAQLFWDVHESVEQVASTEGLKPPSYLQYIILMACKAFVKEKVDAAVVEVGLGGRYDHTNFFSNPCVTVVTSLSLEHTEVLGNTIEEIAGKKAGIFKHGCPAIVSDDQTDGAINVFLSEASKIGCPLYICPRFEELCADNPQVKAKVSNALQSSCPSDNSHCVRTRNMILGLAAVHIWLQRRRGVQFSSGLQPPLRFELDTHQVESALCARWPGRWQTVVRKNATYFLDGAHTNESVQMAAEWFQWACSRASSDCSTPLARVLIFTVLGQRDPEPMLKALKSTVKPGFDLALFANPHDGEFVILPSKQSMDARCLTVWNELCAREPADKPSVPAYRIPNVSQFVNWLSQVPIDVPGFLNSYPQPPDSQENTNSIPTKHTVGRLRSTMRCHVLVTGSLYLVGAALKALDEPV
ncbi:hypothetical protein CRM22_000190 [Opisthorchis felineus]|uniref:tetrahydrofolate synthase n=2 Tax=Opisthorchis felineus TaxID=147828 RepID=A0A4S2MGK4_OPIFE|nr:hypothetical protein CRM22_000190 [Opisthorchis felineus]